MNLIPLSYLRGERYRKWLKGTFFIVLLIGVIGSLISILLPLRIYALQEEVARLKADTIVAHSDQREEMLKGLYEKEERLKSLEEGRGKLNLERAAYFLELEYIFSFSEAMLSLEQVAYEGWESGWKVVGKSRELEFIKLYRESLLSIYSEEELDFQIEKEGEVWYFSFVLVKEEGAKDEALE